MRNRDGFLVIGGDSLVGSALVRALAGRGHRVLATTRRRETLSAERVYLDFEGETPFRAPSGIQYAFFVAAATNYDRCESDPLARRINVELIPAIVASLLEQSLFVTFVSSNSVFGGERPWPNEDDPHAPGIAYARQKSEGEKAIQAAAVKLKAVDRLNIVRLTKILDRDTPPVPNWLATWKRGEMVQPFSDLIFAPMSVQFVGDALATVGERRVSGTLHLSGAANVSYVNFAVPLAQRLQIDSALIAPTTAVEKKVNIAFKPTFSGLGMDRTTRLTGIKPQTLAEVIDDLCAAMD